MIDRTAAESWLRGETACGDEPLVWEGRATGGSSNVTWFLSVGAHRWVLRHPPGGTRLPSANDVVREHTFLSALRSSRVRVPVPVACCDDPTVAGVPFAVSTRLDGAALHEHVPEALRADRAARHRLAYGLVDALAELHAVDWRARGLEAPRTPYLDRQVRRWTDQLARTATAERLSGLDEVTRWVEANMPAPVSETIVHGDYGLHNVLVSDGADPGITGIIDWELAAIGDPLVDLANFSKAWGPGAPTAAPNPANDALTTLGAPSAADLTAHYERRTGRSVGSVRWYEVFVLWRSLAIFEGLHARHVEGTGVDPSGERFAALSLAQLSRLRDLLGSG